MSQTEKITVDQERKTLINTLNNAGIDYTIEEDAIMINAIPKREPSMYHPITISEFQQKDTTIRIEKLFSYSTLTIKTPDKEYRVPLGREGHVLILYTNTYLKIIFYNLERPPMPEFQKQEIEKVTRFLSEGGVKFEVTDYRIWIEGTPMYVDSYRIIIRQGDDDIEFRRYTADTTLVHRKGNINRHLCYLRTVTAHYAYPYLILTLYNFY